MAYAQRLERDADVGVKEAFRVLHQGLSCLAGQITATDSHSAHIAAQLASNWEQLARRLSDIRVDFDDSHRALDARLSVVEKVSDYSGSAMDHALEKIEAFARQRSLDQAESQRQTSRHEQALERLSDALLRLEKGLPQAGLGDRVEVVEQALAGLNERKKTDQVAPLLAALQALTHRLEALEKDHEAFRTVPHIQPPEPVPHRDEMRAVGEPLAMIEPPGMEFTESDVAPDFEDLFTQTQSESMNFLARARLSTRAAPEAARPRYLIAVIVGGVVVLALAAGLVVHRRAERIVIARPDLPSRTVSMPEPPKTDVPSYAVDSDVARLVSRQMKPGSPDAMAHVPAPLKTRDVRNALVHTVPENAASAPQAAGAPAADRVQQLANQGNVVALTILGLRALDGSDGVTLNLPDAFRYLSQAAEKGQALAQYRLGTMYEHGQGVAIDPVRASHWYELSANQGNRKAMHNLAVFYASKRDMANAARWFAKASSLGLSDSQFNLAVLHERGDGVPQSLIEAFKWYSIAAAAGDIESRARVVVLQTQLNDADKATAAKAVEAFHPLTFDHGANVPPDADQLPSG